MDKDCPQEQASCAYTVDGVDNDSPRSAEHCYTLSATVLWHVDDKKQSLSVPSEKNGACYQVKRPWQIIGICAAAWIHLATGVMIALTGIILPTLINPEPGEMQIDENQAYIFSSIIHFGSIFGSALAGPLMFWLGQRVSLLVSLPISIISWIAIAFAHNYWLLIGSRFVSGLLVGLGTLCASNFVIEICHTTAKGQGVAIIDFFRQLGYIFVYCVGSTGLSWRNVGLTSGVISCAIPLVLFAPLHNSPRWLATKGKTDKAERSLRFYRGKDTDISKELAGILSVDSGPGESIWKQFKSLFEGTILRLTILVLYISIAAQFTGGLATIMYASTIFNSANTGISEYYSTILMGVFRSIGTFMFCICVDRFPRRRIVIVPILLSALCLVILGEFFYLQQSGINVSSMFWLPLTALILFSIFICMGGVSLLMFRSELIPNDLRAVASSLMCVGFSAGGFLSAQSFPYMIKYIGSHGTFWVFAANNVLLATVIFLFVPETQGKSLEEIDELVRDGLKPMFSLSTISQLWKSHSYNFGNNKY